MQVHTILYVLFLFVTINTFSQNGNVKGYRIEGDQIIFSFDKRDYDIISNDVTGEHLEFGDFDIYNVIVSGEFNNWSRDNWKMNRIDDNRFELRKNINDFNDELTWEFKFMINNKFWAEPGKGIKNVTPAKTKRGKPLHVYNLKIFTAYETDDGNVCFKLNGYENARKVILAGSFNRWNEKLFKLKKAEDGWEITLQLKPGIYQYKFIVDGEWMIDPSNPSKTKNEFDGYNSLIDVRVPVTFKLENYLEASKVILAGSFNDWSENDLLMTRTESGWEASVNLSGGKHHYKFIVDGKWLVDPNNPVMEYDGKGNINSVCMVR